MENLAGVGISILFVLLAAGLAIGSQWYILRKNPPDPSARSKASLASLVASFHRPGSGASRPGWVRFLWLALETSLVVALAAQAGRQMLTSKPGYLPVGIDFSLAVTANIFWKDLLRCGVCALWNGHLDGGYPAFLDLLGAPLHPFYAVPTLLFGLVEGGKITVVVCMAASGLAQLWLGYQLRLSAFARLWAALLAAVAGTLTGRMEIGQVTLLVSISSASWLIAALVNAYRLRSARAVVGLGLAGALVLLSGQGYIQIGLALAVLPASLILWAGSRADLVQDAKRLAVAGLLAAGLAAPLLLPLVHHLPQMSKDIERSMINAQPLYYQLRNLVLPDDRSYYQAFPKRPILPFAFNNYLGIGPVLLALLAVGSIQSHHYRLMVFFFCAVVLVYLCSSMALPRLAFGWLPSLLYGIRYPTLITALAGPLILSLAGWGMDIGLNGLRVFLPWERFVHRGLLLTLFRVIFVSVGISALFSSYSYAVRWLILDRVPPVFVSVADSIRVAGPEWVGLKEFNFWNVLALERGVRLANTFTPWHIARYPLPAPYLDIPLREQVIISPGQAPVMGITYVVRPENTYASLQAGDVLIACPAEAQGGLIRLACTAPLDGVLTLKEHAYPGWRAFLDGKPAALLEGNWIKMNIPAGAHTLEVRYLPWDAFVGLGLALAGWLACAVIWFCPPAARLFRQERP